jgi:hypothetical protein
MGNPSVRWFLFDNGGQVTWQNNGAIAGLPSNYIQSCMDVWNFQPSTPIQYRHRGSNNAQGGLLSRDGLHTVLFGDPR